MKKPPAWFRLLMRTVGAVAPRLLLGFVFRLFWKLNPRMAVRPGAAPLQSRARRELFAIGDRSVVIYRWGTGPETVLLVHGWRGRGSQFAELIQALESPERTIVTFDAPGNGDSPGDATDLRDYLAVIRAVAAEVGTIDLLVGHSFGVMGIFVAVREGVSARRLVAIAGLHDMDYTFHTFVSAMELPKRLTALLRRKIERDVFAGDDTIWRRFVSELDPTNQTPLLVIADRDDRAISCAQSERIVADHLGPTTSLFTTGLGHTRVLSDQSVVDAVRAFANEPAQTR